MITITRKGLQLAINDEIIPAQGSSDVPVRFINDNETYQNYLIEPRVGWFKDGYPKSTLAKYENGIIYLPAEVFAQNGKVVIVIALIDPQNSNHIEVTQPVISAIAKAPLGDITLPEKETWEQAVTSLVKQLNEQIQADVAEAIKKANKASEDATEALNISNQTNQTINEKIEDGSFIPQATAGTVEMTQPGTKAEVTITGDKKNPEFNFKIPKDEIDDSEDIKKALLQGTYTTDLSEEYKGVASDFGAEIIKLEGKSEQGSTNGYQLLNPDLFDEDKVDNGLNFTKQEDGSIVLSGSLADGKTATYRLGDYINILEDGKTYCYTSDGNAGVINIIYKDGSPNGYVGTVTVNKSTMKSIQPYIQFNSTSPVKKHILKPMFNEGDKIKPFEVYSGGMPSPNPNYPQEINNALDEPLVSVGRNFANPKKAFPNGSTSINGVSFKPNDDGTITLNGTASNLIDIYYGNNDKAILNLPNGIYLLWNNLELENYFKITGNIYIRDKTEVTNNNKIHVPFVRIPKGKTFNNDILEVMFERSEEKTKFIPCRYAETPLNIELRSLPDGTCDTYDNGVITRRVGVVNVDGNTQFASLNTNHNIAYLVISKYSISENKIFSGLCDKAKVVQTWNLKPNEIAIMESPDLGGMRILFSVPEEVNTLELLKAYFTENPMTVYYPLKTPTTEKVELPIVPTFYHYTNIFQSDDVKARIQYGLRSKVEECPYDIGDLYITLNETLPSVKWKGTKWERVEGLVPVGYKESDADFGTLGKTGGAKTVTLKEEQIPEHGHQAKAKKAGNHKHGIALKTAAGSATPHTGAGIKEGSWSSTDTHAWLDKGLCEELGEHDHVITVENAGGSQAHNNLQPYKVFNMWLRTK